MSDRKAELDRKKAKLQAIRESKERKRRELEQKNADEAAKSYNVSEKERDHIREVDEMLSSLGVAPVSDVLSSLSSNSSLPPEADASTATPPSSLATAASSMTPKSSTKQLSIVKCGETNIPGKELIVYTKQTQTTTTGHEMMRDAPAFDYYGAILGYSLPVFMLTRTFLNCFKKPVDRSMVRETVSRKEML